MSLPLSGLLKKEVSPPIVAWRFNSSFFISCFVFTHEALLDYLRVNETTEQTPVLVTFIFLTMKYSSTVTASRRKNRKAHFASHSEARRKIMSASLSKELQNRHGVRSMPIRKDDEVLIVRGMYKSREGKVITCFRKKFVVHVERITREKVNGAQVPVGIPASNLVITKLKLDKDRKAKLEAKSKNKDGKKEDATMSNVD